jgi:hypothetical protein
MTVQKRCLNTFFLTTRRSLREKMNVVGQTTGFASSEATHATFPFGFAARDYFINNKDNVSTS